MSRVCRGLCDIGLGQVRSELSCADAFVDHVRADSSACPINGDDADGSPATDRDIEAFFACLAGSCCPTCGSTDFNGDGDYATDLDIEAFFRVLSGAPC